MTVGDQVLTTRPLKLIPAHKNVTHLTLHSLGYEHLSNYLGSKGLNQGLLLRKRQMVKRIEIPSPIQSRMGFAWVAKIYYTHERQEVTLLQW